MLSRGKPFRRAETNYCANSHTHVIPPVNKRYRIFLAEDHYPDALLIHAALDALGIGFDLQIFPDGERAKTALEQARLGQLPDLILLDINLPRVNGFDLLQSVKAMVEFNHVPVALLTSSHNPDDGQRASGLKADAFVVKPAGLDNFLREVGLVLRSLLRIAANDDTSLRAFCRHRPTRRGLGPGVPRRNSGKAAGAR